MKAYKVTIGYEFIFAAESPEEAEQKALDEWQETAVSLSDMYMDTQEITSPDTYVQNIIKAQT